MSRYESMNGVASTLGKRELLTSQFDGRLSHAVYPTALVTLCGLDARPDQRGLDLPPDCAVCEQAAREFDRIDKSMPAHWHGYVVALPEAAA